MHNLLIITQKVDENDDVLGFFHEWIREFSKKWNKVFVICLKRGDYDLPDNVRVLSLGKERGLNKLDYLFNFYKYVWQLRGQYDAVFVHMNPKYVVLGWPVWKLLGKTVSLWYAHGYVPLMLNVADKLTDIAFTSTKDGYRIKSGKLKIVGQGIDVNKFCPPASKSASEFFKIVTVGRISPSKDYQTLINAVALLGGEKKLEVKIIGDIAFSEQGSYLGELKKLVHEKGLDDIIKFAGSIANKNLVPVLQDADLFVNMGHTGSLDKANLEAMACGLPLLTCNEAFSDVLGHYSGLLMYPKRDFTKLAERIGYIMRLKENELAKMSNDLRAIVVREHNLDGLVEKITNILAV